MPAARSRRAGRPRPAAPIRSSSSNSSRRCVRIISGPSVAIVNGTSCSRNARNVSRTASSSASALVSRFEVGQISRTIPRSRSCCHQLRVLGGEDAVADPVGAQGLDDLADLGDPVLAALLADVDRHAEAGRARLLHERRRGRGRDSAPPSGRGPAMSMPTTPARRVADRLLDDDPVLPSRERAVHHQDQAGTAPAGTRGSRGRGRGPRP